MRVKVTGNMDAAAALRGYLQKGGTVAVWKEGGAIAPDYTIVLEESAGEFYFDTVDCDLERSVLRHVRDLSQRHIEIRTKGGNQSDQVIRIVFPSDEARAVELGVFRGFEDFAGPKAPAVPRASGPTSAPSSSFVGPNIADLQAAHDRLLDEARTANETQRQLHERLLGETKAAHEETKAQAAATLSDANETISSLNKENSDLAERVRVAESAAAGAAQIEDFYGRLIATKDQSHDRLVEEIRAACQGAIAERDRLAEELKAARAAITPGAADGLARELETAKAFYERLLAEKEARIAHILAQWPKPVAPWWKRLLGLA